MSDTPALDITNLDFAYESDSASPGWRLHIPQLKLERGEQLLLTGGSGRGKSTLLHLICGLMEPDKGKIVVNGTEMQSLHGAKRDLFRGEHIGMIFQDFNLLHGFTAVENVMLALMFSEIPKSEHRDRAIELLKHLGIDQPHRDPQRMSIGQQQRVAVARAVACDPELVLADEPTASLDPTNARIAVELIQQTCRERGAALLCVSHDPLMTEMFEQRVDLDELSHEKEATH